MSTSSQVAVIDSGVANVGSMVNMLKKIGASAVIARKPEDIKAADRIILPGVGSFDAGIRSLRATGLVPALEKRVLEDGVPFLGVCLGMQFLGHRSEEGCEPGLGWVAAKSVRFNIPREKRLPVPHMGWSYVNPVKSHSIWRDLPAESRFYFVHSYHVECDDPADVLLTCEYGSTFVAGLVCRNIIGLQFHPEKSHKYGMALLRNFTGVTAAARPKMSTI